MASPTPELSPSTSFGKRTLRRITYLTPAFGIAAGVLAAILHRWDWTEGLLFGCGLGWLNFRWLGRGLEAFTNAAAAPPGEGKPRTSGAIYLAATFRYALIGLAVYVIFVYLHVPLVSIVSGLCALAAAIIVASVWEIMQSIK
jgi:hypothetical protein